LALLTPPDLVLHVGEAVAQLGQVGDLDLARSAVNSWATRIQDRSEAWLMVEEEQVKALQLLHRLDGEEVSFGD
jgi:hypothetical protein